MIRISLALLASATGASALWMSLRGFRRGVRGSALRALEALPVGALLVDEDLGILWRNSVASKGADAGHSLAVAITIAQAFHPDDAPLVEERLRRLVGKPETEDRFDVRTLRGDGESVPVECVARNLLGADGIDALLLVVRDMAETVRERERFEGELDRAHRRVEEKGRFLAVLGHEIRTPLQALESALRIQSDPATTEVERTELRNLSLRSATSLLQVLDDLLELSRTEARVVPLRSEPFDAMETTRDVAALFAVQVRGKGGSMKAVQEGLNLPVRGDAARIRQILANLVGNSVRHAGESAIEVVYRANAASGGRVLCHWEIRDRGPGISAEEAETMFQMWKRGSNSAGSGLGLAIVQGLVEVMGGSLEAAPRTGGGLSVHVRLPMDAVSGVPSPSESISEPKTFPGSPRVLVAEDDRTNQIVIRRQLENLGCLPTVVTHGQLALDALALASFEMVLLDCQMPVLDGYATCREIRRLETENGSSRLPILAVTAWAMQSDKDRCFDSGMDEVLTKPLRAADLADALGRWLPKDAPG